MLFESAVFALPDGGTVPEGGSCVITLETTLVGVTVPSEDVAVSALPVELPDAFEVKSPCMMLVAILGWVAFCKDRTTIKRIAKAVKVEAARLFQDMFVILR